MMILEQPYVSQALVNTINTYKIAVLQNEISSCLVKSAKLDENLLLKDQQFIELAKKQTTPLIYCNSENPITWVKENLQFTDLPRLIDLFKDKAVFREKLALLYPDFHYQKIAFDDLFTWDITTMKLPFVIKPAVGFFSLGVHVIDNYGKWPDILAEILAEAQSFGSRFPGAVVNSTHFIAEQLITGEEYAIDLYYDGQGQPVILNVLHHLFSGSDDVADRVYTTSKQIIEQLLPSLQKFFTELGAVFNVRNFPMHVEVRIDEQGTVAPIEVNPLRFAGWCTTDIAEHAWGINVYQTFLQQTKPDWQSILAARADEAYSIIVAEVPAAVDVNEVHDFDYEKFQNYFSNPLETRIINYREKGVFAFIFARTEAGQFVEIEKMIDYDLSEFIILKSR